MQRLLARTILILLMMVSISQAASDSAITTAIPWSGYWWPTTGGGLSTGISYRGHPAPLEKYELLKDGAYPGPATQWDLANNYDPTAPSWFGLCGAWAAAAVLEDIDFYPSVIDNIIFYVGDKKGLMTALHELSWEVGIRENPETPDIFHRWLLQYIKSLGIAFYAELDPTEEAWNYPIFKYVMETTQNGTSMDVVCTIWYADDQVDPDFQGTRSLSAQYTYRLYLSGGAITGGEWTGASTVTRPSQLILPTVPKARNPYLDYAFIKNIATSIDDALESDDVVSLDPGGYNLILLNTDAYQLNGDIGDTFFLRLDVIDDIDDPITFQVKDGEGTTVYQNTVSDTAVFQLTSVIPPYQLIVDRSDYSGGGVYRLEYDLKKRFEFANTKLQKGFGWGGMAIVNGQSDTCSEVYVVGYTAENRPMETYIGPLSLAPGEKRVFFFSDLAVRSVEKNDLFGIKVLAPMELGVINLMGYFDRNMSCYGNASPQQWMALPDTVASWNTAKSVSWGLYNPNPTPVTAHLALISALGDTLDAIDLEFGANAAVHYNRSNSPFGISENNGWIRIQTANDDGLIGYVEWIESGISKADALHLPGSGNTLVLPHLVRNGTWSTRVTLINTDNSSNSVTLNLVAGASLSSQTIVMGPQEKQTIALNSMFADLSTAEFNSAAMVIQSNGRMSGFFCYDTASDYMCYPLLDVDDMRASAILPHIASGTQWWTGVTLFNPTNSTAKIQFLPFDSHGEPMDSAIAERTLPPWQKYVCTAKDLFGSLAPTIAFMTISSQGDGRFIGVYGIGNPDYTMLSGDVLQ